MFGLSWWVWVIIVVVVLVVLYWLALQGMSKAFRLMIRREFVDFLKAVNPDVEVDLLDRPIRVTRESLELM